MQAHLQPNPNPFFDDIVQEWAPPSPAPDVGGVIGLSATNSNGIDPSQIDLQLEKEALENGIEKPKGHTVSFHYNSLVEQHHFGPQHPMKPWRLTLTKQLVLGYGLHFALDLFESEPATREQLASFHSSEYLEFLRSVTPLNPAGPGGIFKPFRDQEAEGDCPIFDGLWDYVRFYSGATLDATHKLLSSQSDIAINWTGGLHHAKKKQASGFCYINDIVLAIQQLLTLVPRVLYIDIDVHHGDGVEQAFWSTDRVLTLSYHKFGLIQEQPEKVWFFPGTGRADDIGPKALSNPGAHHSLNVPLKDGIDDDEYEYLFDNTCGPVIEKFDPSAIVLQCGADSLGGDKLGKFNLNIRAHGHCVDFVKSLCHNRPLLILGGGGYTPRNVARAWCHETSLCTGTSLPNELPQHIPYRQAFTGELNGDGKLYPNLSHIPQRRHENEHSREYLEEMIANIKEQLRYLEGAPSVQMREIPADYLRVREEEDARFREEAEEGRRERIADGERRRRERGVGVRAELR